MIIWQVKFILNHADSDFLNADAKTIYQQRLKRQPKQPSAGCVFKNLVLQDYPQKSASLVKLIKDTKIKGGKLACGQIIETLELKGTVYNQALISLEHANFIVNQGQASSEDVRHLIRLIKNRVHDVYGLELEEEICLVGF